MLKESIIDKLKAIKILFMFVSSVVLLVVRDVTWFYLSVISFFFKSCCYNNNNNNNININNSNINNNNIILCIWYPLGYITANNLEVNGRYDLHSYKVI